MNDILFFTSNGCGPCDIIKEKIMANLSEYIDVKIIDLSKGEGREYLKKYNIRGVPTLIFKGEVFIGLDAILDKLGL